jgi:hypothetical protein
MPYAGKPIYNYTIPSTFNLHAFMVHVLESASLLLVHSSVHFDLHSGNILIDDKQIPRMIDFNLSMSADVSIPESQLSYRYSRNFHLPQQPPDYTCVIGINQHKDSSKIVRNIDDKKIMKDIKSILQIPRDKVVTDILTMCNKNSYVSRGDILGWFYKYWTKIDSWAIGTYFIDMLKVHSITPQIYSQYKAKQAVFKKMLVKLCEINPDQRWDCMQALYYLHPHSIVIRKYGASWLNKTH